MMRIVVLIVFYLAGMPQAFGQTGWQAVKDSLLHALAIQNDDSDKVITLINLGGIHEANNPDTAVYYYSLAGTMADKLNDNYGKLRYMACMIEILEMQAKYDSALQFCLRGIAFAQKTHNRHALAAMYNNTASIYGDIGYPEKVLEYYQLAVALYERLKTKGDTANLATVYGNILAVYVDLEQHAKAYTYGLRAIALSRQIGNNDALAVSLTNLGDLLVKMKRYDTAMLLARQLYALSKQMNDKTFQIRALGSMSAINLETKQPDGVIANATEMERLAKETKDVDGLANAYYFAASYYFNIKKYAQAKAFALKELALVKQNNLKGGPEKNVPIILGDIALAMGDIEAFVKYRHTSDSLQDFYVSNKILKYSQELQAKYSLDKKQTEIEDLKKEKEIQQLTISRHNIINLVFAGVIIVAMVMALLFYRNYLQKNKLYRAEDALKQQRIAELEKEKQLLAAESVLQGQEEERKRLAKDLHDGLGGILSSVKYSFTNMKTNLIITAEGAEAFDRSMQMLDKSISELRRVAHNMMPEALVNFGLDSALKDFCQGINQGGAVTLTYQSFGLDDETVAKNKASVVYRIIQELVNNILKHAAAKTALVQLVYKNEGLSITVEDDGKGFDQAILQSSSGIGYANLQSRVAYLAGSMDVQTSAGKGTSINIEIPNTAA